MLESVRTLCRATFTGVVGMALAGPLHAQTALWVDREAPRAAWLELGRPSFKEAEGFSALLFTLGGRFPVSRGMRAVVEVPIAQSSIDGNAGDYEGTMIGNVLVGIEGGSMTQGIRGGLGVRVPVVGDDAPAGSMVAGMYGDWDRVEAYLPKTMSLQLDVSRRWLLSSGAILDVGLTPVTLVPTSDGDVRDVELLIGFHAGGGIETEQLGFMAWYTGRWFATAGDDADPGEDFSSHLAVSATYKAKSVRPFLFVRFAMDDPIKDYLSNLIGAGVTFAF